MSSVKQKVKEGKTKSKIKVISKPKIILANPIKPKVPSLEVEDFEKLQEFLVAAIKKCQLNGRAYATSTNINIGLESTLRAINNCKAGCVFLSSNIKPKYVLGLIARNAQLKDAQVPVFVQTDLESKTQNIFDVGALALTLPKDGKGLSVELQTWIETHRLPKPMKLPALPLNPRSTKVKKQKILNAASAIEKLKASEEKNETKLNDLPQKTKSWGNDYMSFSNEKSMDVDDDETSSDDHEKLQNALNQMMNKVKETTTAALNSEATTTPLQPVVEKQEKTTTSNENSDEDDFLDNYAPLTLHKIAPNPNRKPRNKRKKQKKSKQKA